MLMLIILIIFAGSLNAQNLLNGPEGIFYHSPTSTYYVANANDGKIITIDQQSVHNEFVSGLSMPMEVLIVENTLYVTGNDPKKFYSFDITTGEMILEIAINDALGLSGMCYDERTDLIYIADQGGRLLTFNRSTEIVDTYINTGQGVSTSVQDIVLDVENDRLVICFYSYGTSLKEINLTTGTVTSISGTGGGNHVGINMDLSGHFYVSNWSTNEVLYYSNDFSESGVFSTGHNQPVGITFNYDINFLAVANFGGNSVDLEYLYLTDSNNEEIPDSGNLELEIFPNPFNPRTSVSYQLTSVSDIEIGVYNIRGEKVKDLLNSKCDPGNYTVIWDGTDEYGRSIASGFYFCTLTNGESRLSKKMILLK